MNEIFLYNIPNFSLGQYFNLLLFDVFSYCFFVSVCVCVYVSVFIVCVHVHTFVCVFVYVCLFVCLCDHLEFELELELEYDMDQLFSKQKPIHRQHYIVTNSLVRYFIDSLPHSFHTNFYTN